jgi:hypothetical protein
VVTRASQKCFSFSTKTAIIQIDNFLVPLFLIPDFATLSKKNPPAQTEGLMKYI